MLRFFRRCYLLLLGVVLVLAASSHAAEQAKQTVDFNRQVRPILSEHCFACHGPDEKDAQGEASAGCEGRYFRTAPETATALS